MSIFDPMTWQACSPKEVIAHLAKSKSGHGQDDSQATSTEQRPSALVIQTLIAPIDIYAYLKARFGKPNGIQSIIVEEDSNNIFHWDYYLKCIEGLIIFTGATQEVHALIKRPMSDDDWLKFIKSLKYDFSRMGREKSEIIKSLEKWYVFPNRFLAIANRCADLHQRLSMALPRVERDMNAKIVRSSDPDFVLKSKRRSKLISDISECCIELPILMPIMFETFIGMIVAFLTKASVRGNERLFQTFKKSALDVKIFDLHTRCDGFIKPVDPANPIMSSYWSVVNRRNDIMHGNVDPVRDATEVIYFDGKKPLYTSGADRIVYHWQGLIRQYDPERVLRDYLTTHEFIIEILDHMTPSSRQTFMLLMAESQPGWDDRRKKLGILFPDHLHMTNYGELRYDGDLKA